MALKLSVIAKLLTFPIISGQKLFNEEKRTKNGKNGQKMLARKAKKGDKREMSDNKKCVSSICESITGVDTPLKIASTLPRERHTASQEMSTSSSQRQRRRRRRDVTATQSIDSHHDVINLASVIVLI